MRLCAGLDCGVLEGHFGIQLIIARAGIGSGGVSTGTATAGGSSDMSLDVFPWRRREPRAGIDELDQREHDYGRQRCWDATVVTGIRRVPTLLFGADQLAAACSDVSAVR